jgi:hypothetical protein
MKDDLLWLRMLLMLAIFCAMFAVPVVVITLDERRKRRDPVKNVGFPGPEDI